MTNGSADVIATGAQFITNTKPGDIFVVLTDGMIYEIDEIVSATQLKLKRAYAGATGDGLQYEIVPTASYLKTLATQVSDLIALYTKVPEDVAASASAASDSAKAAATSAATAASSASDATAAKAAAATSETNAANSASAAAASKTAAATSEANAASSASAASSKSSAAAASATAAASSEARAASSAAAAATSEANAAATLAGALKATSNLSDVSDKAVARANLDVPTNAALATKVSKAGDTMTGTLISNGAGYAGGTYRVAAEIGGAFVDWTKERTFAVQVDCPNFTSAYGGIRWTRWGARHLAAIDAYEGGTATSQPTLVLHLANQNSAWTFSNTDIVRGAGGAVWGEWNFNPYLKINRSGDTMAGRLNLSADKWQADLGLRSGNNDNTWTYLRARGGGGFEVINNAYNAVPWAVDDWGNMFTRGLHVMQTNGNLFCQYRNAWMSDILNDLYSRDDSKIDWGNANDRWNQTVQRDPANVHRYWWDGGNRRVIISIDGQSVAYVASNLSDMRLKTNIAATREDSLSKVNAIKFKEFDWRDSGKHQRLGVLAQQAKLLDESFVYQPPGDPLDPTKSPMMLDANSMLLTALHAIQQLSAKVDDLERRLAPSTS
ncbi:tail fiber domain-containing protein [Burkholderia ubonensis]|uniref:tail fiber domain-containing protein n=1 Tax=Burkholderia ubonensis TaxID=101571 RepID=UPI001160BC2A|nr:tail fiber domain-containing protein [Burkholderia ubonensis]